MQKRFQFEQLEWEYSEKKQPKFFSNLALKMRPGKYDFVLFLAGYSSHRSARFIEACHGSEIPVAYIPSGYSVNQIAKAIRQQILPREKKFA